MADSKKPSHFSGLMRKLSGRSKKGDKESNVQPAASSSRGADTLSPYAALDSKGQPSVGSSSSKGAENLPPHPAYTSALEFSAPSSDSEDPPPYDAPIVDPPVKEDDRFSFLKDFDTVFLIDDSNSMTLDQPSRWKQVGAALSNIAPVCTKYDPDGIDIYFLNQHTEEKNITSAEEVTRIFKKYQPHGWTPTGERLKHILNPYVKHCEDLHENGLKLPDRCMNVIVITDGVPTDEKKEDRVPAVLGAIGERLKRIDAERKQLGVMFCQVGNEDGAKEALEKLDDKLSDDYDCDDFIDYLKYEGTLTGEKLLKLVLGAVHTGFDRKKA